MNIKLPNIDIKEDYGRKLFEERGIENVDRFIAREVECLQTWEDLENIEEGVQLIAGLPQDAKIAIVVDCDTDGYTSAAILTQFISESRSDLVFTSFFHSGKQHGLEDTWKVISEQEFDLILIPDAGTNDGQYAEKLSAPVLVIDHHLPEEGSQSSNMIIINNQMSPEYHNKFLSGAGMAYQFCRALEAHGFAAKADDYLDLAALGIVSDMMSGLEPENQWFWKEGFSRVNNRFFKELLIKQEYSISKGSTGDITQIIPYITPDAVSYYIAPLINALIRVGDVDEKSLMFSAFVEGDSLTPTGGRGKRGELIPTAVEVVRLCVNARNRQKREIEKAESAIEAKIYKHGLLDNEILFVRLDEDELSLPKELNGLLAMRLADKYKKPTIVARLGNDGMVKGSLRHLSNTELTSFKSYLESTGLFEYVQGHALAAGLAIPNSSLDELHAIANVELLNYSLGKQVYEVEFARKAADDDIKLIVYDLDNYKDFWTNGNQEPLIYIKDIEILPQDIIAMGSKKDTIKFMNNGITYIKFKADDFLNSLPDQNFYRLNIVGRANLNEWNGHFTPQIVIKDFEFQKPSIFDF